VPGRAWGFESPFPHHLTSEESVLRVAIQGELGAFSHEAAIGLLGPGIEIVPAPSFDALFATATGGEADRALVPIENSLAGSIHENYDRLAESPLHIVAETHLRIRLCLIVRHGATLASLRRVASHPVALGQCRRFFAQHPAIEAVNAYDTAGSVRKMSREDDSGLGAIASRFSATLYGAHVLIEGIEDDARNFTRFLLLGKEPALLEKANKTSVFFALRNEAGALHRAIGLFANRGVDLAKIESRPRRGRPWEYAFYLDVLGDPSGPAGEALAELQSVASDVRILGSYPEGLSAAIREASADGHEDLRRRGA
jgi:prephenate dehydratase